MFRWLMLAVLSLLFGCSAGKKSMAYEADYAYPSEAPMMEMEESDRRSGRMAAPSAAMGMAAMDGDYAMADDEMSMPQPEPQVGTVAGPDRMVHYDGYARLRVTRVEDGIDAVRALAEARGGRVEYVGERSITVRVPVDGFRAAFDEVLAQGEVLDKRMTAQDVTAAYTSVELRLRTAEAARDRLQALLARAEEENEKLALIRQIQRLTEQIDAFAAQERTLASLASLSRISVELVPRESLAFQDAEDETLQLAWIRGLSPFTTAAPVESRDLELPVPEGLVRLDERGPFVAEAADGARMWSWRTRNAPEGDAHFWLSALEGRLATEFASAKTETIGGWKVLHLLDRADAPYTWSIGVRVDGRWLHVVQILTPSPEATQRHDAAVRAALTGGAA